MGIPWNQPGENIGGTTIGQGCHSYLEHCLLVETSKVVVVVGVVVIVVVVDVAVAAAVVAAVTDVGYSVFAHKLL